MILKKVNLWDCGSHGYWVEMNVVNALMMQGYLQWVWQSH